MKKGYSRVKLGTLVITLLVVAVLAFVSCSNGTTSTTSTTAARTTIEIGLSSSEHGPLAAIRTSAFDPIYKLWVTQVNAAGGINVGGKKMLVNVTVLDDNSDVNQMSQNLEKLITVNKVDFIFPPCSTAMAFAAAPIAAKYGYILSTAEAGATTIEGLMATLPTVFVNLNYSDWNQIPVLADELSSLGVKSVYMVSTNDLFGIEYSGQSNIYFQQKGIKVDSVVIPLSGADYAQIVAGAKAANDDAFVTWCYPDQNMPITGQSIAAGFNPKFFMTGPTANFGWYHDPAAGGWGDAVNGVSCFASWSPDLSPAMATLADQLYTSKPDGTYVQEPLEDWWGHCYYWAGLQIFQQAIEKAGTLNQATVANIMQTGSFNTILSPNTSYTSAADVTAGTAPCRGLLDKADQPAQIGQWQKQANGTFKVVLTAGNKTTAQPVYPKPAWPAAK